MVMQSHDTSTFNSHRLKVILFLLVVPDSPDLELLKPPPLNVPSSPPPPKYPTEQLMSEAKETSSTVPARFETATNTPTFRMDLPLDCHEEYPFQNESHLML